MTRLTMMAVGALLALPVQGAQLIEIELHGMTCGFCVDVVQRGLRRLPDVAAVELSLEHKRVRIRSVGDELDLARVRQLIIDAGFTPVTLHRIDAPD